MGLRQNTIVAPDRTYLTIQCAYYAGKALYRHKDSAVTGALTAIAAVCKATRTRHIPHILYLILTQHTASLPTQNLSFIVYDTEKKYNGLAEEKENSYKGSIYAKSCWVS